MDSYGDGQRAITVTGSVFQLLMDEKQALAKKIPMYDAGWDARGQPWKPCPSQLGLGKRVANPRARLWACDK
ncbi:hypothetical protein ACU8KH_00047 [Lachancea thermotolerans]